MRQDARGAFVERKDNTIILQTFSMDVGDVGVVVSEGPAGGGGGPITNQSGEQGPQVEVVITKETVIYRDATEMLPPSGANESLVIQQVRCFD